MYWYIQVNIILFHDWFEYNGILILGGWGGGPSNPFTSHQHFLFAHL